MVDSEEYRRLHRSNDQQIAPQVSLCLSVCLSVSVSSVVSHVIPVCLFIGAMCTISYLLDS